MRRRFFILVSVLVGLWTIGPFQAQADQPSFRVFLDVTDAPEVGTDAVKASALVKEWYPKINGFLFDHAHPLPFNLVVLSFEPNPAIKNAPAFAMGNVIHVNSNYIQHMPDDFRALMVHELTHINQHYPSKKPDSVWIIEGIADYVRHKYYEKDIQLTLRMNSKGQLTGYSSAEPLFYNLQSAGTSLDDRGYLQQYTVAATFLYWLEARKDPDIIHHLNTALSQDQYKPDLFRILCGRPLDDLWGEFVTESKTGRPALGGPITEKSVH